MRRRIVFLIALSLTVAAADKRAPAKLVFPAKSGQVIFDHAAHVRRAKDGCKTCHDGLWPQSSKTPLKSSEGCRSCHQAGGKAFEMKGNCAKCHVPAAARASKI